MSWFKRPGRDLCCGTFANHDDDLVDKTVLPSAAEQCYNSGSFASPFVQPLWFYKKKLILTFKCTRCNRVHVIEKENP